MKKKIVFTILFLFVIATAASFQPLAQASKKPFKIADLKIPETYTKPTQSVIKNCLSVEPAGIADLPNDVITNMSKAEIYELQRVPGYYTPRQISAQKSILLNNPQPILAVVIVDDEMREQRANQLGYSNPEDCPWSEVYAWAYNILESGDDALETNYGIDIQLTIASNWETPDNLDYYALLYLIDDIDPRTVGCDILMLMTGQQMWGIDGLAWIYGTPGAPMDARHFLMDCTVSLPANLFQHESSHLFGCLDHGWDPFNLCCMSSAYLYFTRGWCGGCQTILTANRARYD